MLSERQRKQPTSISKVNRWTLICALMVHGNNKDGHQNPGVVIAITGGTGQVYKNSHRKQRLTNEGKKEREEREEREEMTTLQYLEWFMNHEINCLMNHDGNPP